MSLLWSKKGFRGEYLAKYIVSKFAFISESNVSEDYGIDFYCGLIKNSINPDFVHYDKPFLLQIKTKTSSSKTYKKPDIKYWTKDKIDTIFNLNLPFFIGFLDLKEKKLDIHSTSMMWHTYLSSENVNNITRLTFRFRNEPVSDQKIWFPKLESVDYNKIKKLENRGGNGQDNIIDLGDPILSINLKNIDDNVDDLIKVCIEGLSKCIDRENDNIMNKKLNLYYYRWLHEYKTNEPETFQFGYNFFEKEDGIKLNPENAINKLDHYLISLAIAFKDTGDLKNYENVCKLTRLISNKQHLTNIKGKYSEIYTKPKKK